MHTLMTLFSLARPVRQRLLHLKFSVSFTRRWLAEAAVLTPEPSNPKQVITTMGPVDWRKHKVPVREDHGLWAFFRRRELEAGKELTGEAKYMVCESPTTRMADSGRGWKAEELRLKSFKDMHILWYVLLRERNLLATQKEETKRMGVPDPNQRVNGRKVYYVRKSMARIKQILNERRLAYEKAYDIASAEQEAYHNEQVLNHLRDTRRRRLAARAAAQDAASEVQEDKTTAELTVETSKTTENAATKMADGMSEVVEKSIV